MRRAERPLWQDCIALCAISVISAAPFFAGLGFYSDDWAFLHTFTESGGGGLSPAILHGLAYFPPRPGQGVLDATLVTAFGTNPLPYHLFNLAVCSGFAMLLYAVLLRFGADRPIAFATAALFIVWPQLSTVRVWFAAFQIPLSGVFFLINTWIELSPPRRGATGIVRKLLSLAMMAASLSLYELFAPAFVLVALGLGWERGRAVDARTFRARIAAALPFVPNILLVLVTLFLKAQASPRGASSSASVRYILDNLLSRSHDPLTDWGINLWSMFQLHFVEVPLAVVRSPLSAFAAGPAAIILTAAIAAGLVAAWRVWRGGPAGLSVRAGFRLIALGIPAFLVGYAIFLTTPSTSLALSGMGNRTAFAASIGVVLVILGLLALCAAPFGGYRRAVFSLLVGTTVALSALRLATIGSYWAKADDIRASQLRHAREDLAGIPDGSVVLVDGICPYWGPGVVLETDWDATGFLWFETGRRFIADVATGTVADGAGVTVSFGERRHVYPYGARLFLYHAPERRLDRLTGRDAAEAALRRGSRRETSCPLGYEAHGVPI